MMNLLCITLLFSLFRNNPSNNGTKPLTWADFKGPVPEKELSVAARTSVDFRLEATDSDGVFSFRVWAEFKPYESFVRYRTDLGLRHENTHWYIACINARECMKALAPYQHKRGVQEIATAIYNRYSDESDRREDQFDLESNHSQIADEEARWEKQIRTELNARP